MSERARSLVFVGFMGAGKTAAARLAAGVLGVEAVDADHVLESRAGATIAEIFEREGEAAFRQREEALALELIERGGVISLGGGAVESAPVREALAQAATVWVEIDGETAWERSAGTGRPLARDRGEFAARLEARRPLYAAVARAVVPGTGSSVERALPWILALDRAPEARLAWAATASAEYPAVVGPGALGLLPADRRWFAVADARALAAQRGIVPAHEGLVEVPAGEGSKTLAEAERVLRELAGLGARRDDGILAFGGGVVGDLAGFCASTYQRGVAVVQAPTTLVAQVDSAYGGKTGVDLPEAKNYVGAYHQPLAVLADPRALATLPSEELAAGMAEVVKTALVAGGALWEEVRSLPGAEPERLGAIVFECARTKIAVVAEDERDCGRRAVLNLGHTVGHAIEAATSYGRYRHGEAVALGLLAALRLSGAEELHLEVAELLARFGLPDRLDPEVEVDAVIEAVGRDKKRTAAGVPFVLVEAPGRVRHGQPVGEEAVRAAVEGLRIGSPRA